MKLLNNHSLYFGRWQDYQLLYLEYEENPFIIKKASLRGSIIDTRLEVAQLLTKTEYKMYYLFKEIRKMINAYFRGLSKSV
jgi:hypothetical protein